MARIIIVSNRLPITLNRKDGGLIYHPSAGGLATGLSSLDESIEKIWLGWPGTYLDPGYERENIEHQFHKDGLSPIFLSPHEVRFFYEGFSNNTIWPMFHYFPEFIEYNESYWKVYQEVNQKFADRICELIQEDDIVWVHDYQLMLVPGMVRKERPDATIGFFLHIPFPSYEIFRTLPWREEILRGILGADLIGFHTFGYMRHFLSSVYRLTGKEQNFGKVTMNSNRTVNVDVFPMGINYEKYARGAPTETPSTEVQFIQDYGERRKLIISIDRLDYSKGIPQRIEAFGKFLEKNKKYHGEVTLILVVVPSRSNVEQYSKLKDRIDTAVGRLNGRFGTFHWIPIRYYYRSFPFESLSAMYKSSHIAMITPVRDGMNLVAKEFVASRDESKSGVLILSEMAGAAEELFEALLINPNNSNDMVAALEKAMEMSPEEQASRLTEMQNRLKDYEIKKWASNFIDLLMDTKTYQNDRRTKLLNEDRINKLCKAYKEAKTRLLLLDYDGTLRNFVNDPAEAKPDPALYEDIDRLIRQKGTKVVIISGRDRHTLGEWFGHTGIELISEHGVWTWKEGDWKLNERVSDYWKGEVRPILDNLVDRTPGSFVEEKDFTLAWHYRRIDKELGAKRVREIREGLIYLTANHNLQVLEGNKVVEVRNAGVNKGKAAQKWIKKKNWNFMLAIGDDHTDEDTFKAMPADAYTIKVGLARTDANYKVLGTEEARALIAKLANL
jgi:trehalose 6-phosphate synthase/phosphatase